MSRIQTRALVEGAIFAAITVLIGIIRFYIPPIAIISVIWAVPIIIIGFRHGLKVSIISTIVASVLVSVLTSPVNGVELFVSFAVPGIAMGYMLNKKINPTLTIFVSGFLIGVCSVLGITLAGMVSGISAFRALDLMFEGIRVSWDQQLKMSMELSKSMGGNQAAAYKMMPTGEQMVEKVKLILPAGVLIAGVMAAYINFKTVKLILKRIGYIMEDIKPFSKWSPSEPIRVGLLICILLMLGLNYAVKHPVITGIGTNLMYIFAFAFFIMGLSVLAFLLEKYNFSKNIKIFLLIFIGVSFSQYIIILGFADTGFNIRKWMDKRAGGAV